VKQNFAAAFLEFIIYGNNKIHISAMACVVTALAEMVLIIC